MKRTLKIVGTVLGAVVALVVCAALAVYLIGRSRAGGGDPIAVRDLPVASDSQVIARGDHLVNAVTACAGCHDQGLKGKMFGTPAALVSMAAPNLTPAGVGQSNAPADWDRAIRHGVGRDGRRLIIMPSESYRALSDSDFSAMISYLRTLVPQHDTLPARSVGPLGGLLIGAGIMPLAARTIAHDKVGTNHPVAGETAEYGDYLTTIASCASCHGADLNGQKAEHGAPAAPSLLALTSSWSADDFRTTLRTGKNKAGKALANEMPWQIYGKMTDEELGAIFRYLTMKRTQTGARS